MYTAYTGVPVDAKLSSMCLIIAVNGDQQSRDFDLCVIDLPSAAAFGRIAACIGTDVHLWRV